MGQIAQLTPDILDAVYSQLGVADTCKLLIGVSGGADSLALALLSHQVRQIETLTVDHGLRQGSADEAAEVAGWMADAGIPHTVLKWQGSKPASNIQAAARAARYRLFGQHALEKACRHVAVAHHREDQAETFLLRLARGSGLKGLGGMAPRAPLPGCDNTITLVRPLLAYSKASLVTTLEAKHQPWIEDPSNACDAFDRVKARKLLSNPPLEGLNTERLARTADALRRAGEALVFYEEQLFTEAVMIDEYGMVRLQVAALRAAPEEVAMRLFARLLGWFNGGNFAPRFEKMQDMFMALEADMPARTLAGVCVKGDGDTGLMLYRELATTDQEDGRWFASDAGSESYVAPLGQSGVKQLADMCPAYVADKYDYSQKCALSAVWRGTQLQYLLKNGETARLRPVFPGLQAGDKGG